MFSCNRVSRPGGRRGTVASPLPAEAVLPAGKNGPLPTLDGREVLACEWQVSVGLGDDPLAARGLAQMASSELFGASPASWRRVSCPSSSLPLRSPLVVQSWAMQLPPGRELEVMDLVYEQGWADGAAWARQHHPVLQHTSEHSRAGLGSRDKGQRAPGNWAELAACYT